MANWWILTTGRGQGVLHRRRPADYPGAKTSWPKMWGLKGVPFCGEVYVEAWAAYLERKRQMVREEAQGSATDRYVPKRDEKPDGLALLN